MRTCPERVLNYIRKFFDHLAGRNLPKTEHLAIFKNDGQLLTKNHQLDCTRMESLLITDIPNIYIKTNKVSIKNDITIVYF